jgi:hypothetical protein
MVPGRITHLRKKREKGLVASFDNTKNGFEGFNVGEFKSYPPDSSPEVSYSDDTADKLLTERESRPSYPSASREGSKLLV